MFFFHFFPNLKHVPLRCAGQSRPGRPGWSPNGGWPSRRGAAPSGRRSRLRGPLPRGGGVPSQLKKQKFRTLWNFLLLLEIFYRYIIFKFLSNFLYVIQFFIEFSINFIIFYNIESKNEKKFLWNFLYFLFFFLDII